MEKKQCAFCAEEVKAEARRCRYCREWIRRTDRVVRSPSFGVLIIYLVLLISYLIFVPRSVESTRETYEGQLYSDHVGNIVISSHRMSFSATGEEVYVVGEIKNVGYLPWEWITLRADFFDENMEMIDRADDILSIELRPGQTATFKAINCHPKEQTGYADYRVYVTEAYCP